MTESKGLKYEELALPYYINSREVFAGLTVSDLARASVLGGLNLFLVGDTGTGKSQLASDIYRHWFGGNKAEKGQGVFIRAHPDTNVYEEIFTNLNIERKQRELTDSLEALVFLVEETAKESFYAGKISVEPDVLCIKSVDNKINLRLEGKGNHVLLSQWV